jgi:hypothetical protein
MSHRRAKSGTRLLRRRESVAAVRDARRRHVEGRQPPPRISIRGCARGRGEGQWVVTEEDCHGGGRAAARQHSRVLRPRLRRAFYFVISSALFCLSLPLPYQTPGPSNRHSRTRAATWARDYPSFLLMLDIVRLEAQTSCLKFSSPDYENRSHLLDVTAPFFFFFFFLFFTLTNDTLALDFCFLDFITLSSPHRFQSLIFLSQCVYVLLSNYSDFPNDKKPFLMYS